MKKSIALILTVVALAAMTITAAEQQTMNYYMNQTGFYHHDLGRRLYQEIALIEEQHVSQYEALMDPNVTWLECSLMHEYAECYLYWSCAQTESDPSIKAIWEQGFEQELAHLHKAAAMLEQVEGRHWQQVIPNADFPAPIVLEANIPYVRSVLTTVQNTCKGSKIVPVQSLDASDPFFAYQSLARGGEAQVASHAVIDQAVSGLGRDYRFETAPHPVSELQDCMQDNTTIGSDPNIPGYNQITASKA